jgi:hypothetical protein
MALDVRLLCAAAKYRSDDSTGMHISVEACPGVAVNILCATFRRGEDFQLDNQHQCKLRVDERST